MRARKYQVVLSLLRKQRDASKLCEKNDQKQNLLHVLAINKPENTDVQIKVCGLVIYYWTSIVWAEHGFSIVSDMCAEAVSKYKVCILELSFKILKFLILTFIYSSL